jgi:hypothetical protein
MTMNWARQTTVRRAVVELGSLVLEAVVVFTTSTVLE